MTQHSPAPSNEVTPGYTAGEGGASGGSSAVSLSPRDPFARVFSLGQRALGVVILTQLTFMGFSVEVHALVAGLHFAPPPRPAAVVDETPIDVTLETPPPPPEPPPEEPSPEEKPSAVPTPPQAAAAAQAAQVIAAIPNPNKPEDFSAWTIPTGTASSYAGGNTEENGTSSTAVRTAHVAPNGVPGGQGTGMQPQVVAPPPKVSHARAAGLTSRDWRCPFPPEADTAQVDEAVVSIEVAVKADGTPASVRILSDPGNGFGRMAYQCAMRQRFTPALDLDGNPVPGVVRPPVHFNR